ncbi:site-specific integrase [Virgibacillus salexigens]|uniref:Site-specific tyrosine recombinase XerC n=1 Tax=Virgibacillus massiliensis TaxID=1462526 RepID=A0A024QHZ3_9BACI|nr:site-specific integrase [Virgibacillus massiliensis]CDQ42119.1 site-specific tyrosine recombinase XerC [Virgibacillus massiliensis]
MNEVQPIRDKEKIEEMKRVLAKKGSRNVFLFVLGINTGLRVSDMLNLKMEDVVDKEHITIKEKKTDKRKRFLINRELQKHIDSYTTGMNEGDFLFKSYRSNNPIKRIQAYNILNEAAKEVGIQEIGTHTMRKTFGYHFYKRSKDVALLQEIFNHSSPSITKRYIGINQDEIDEALNDFNL